MPIETAVSRNLLESHDVPLTPVTPGGRGDAKKDIAVPTFRETLGAEFERENTIGSAYARESLGLSTEVDYDLKPYQEIVGTKYERHWARFASSRNRDELELRKREIDREEENQRIIEASPYHTWIPSMLAATILDPTTLIPGGAFVRGARGGLAIGKQALRTGTAAAGGVAVQEAGLHATQDLRTLEESALNIGAAGVLGGLLGAGGGALISRGEWKKYVTKLEREMQSGELPATPPVMSPLEAASGMGISEAGAARAQQPLTLAQTKTAGKAAQIAESITEGLQPVAQVTKSVSPVMRNAAMRLVDTSKHIAANIEGVASPRSAETRVIQENAGLMQAIGDTRANYSQYRKREGNAGFFAGVRDALAPSSPRTDFSDAVGMAMRRGDQSATPEVAAVAQSWRKNVFEPLHQKAMAVGLYIVKNVLPDGAMSYFSRFPIVKKLLANEQRFKTQMAAEQLGQMNERFGVAAGKHNKRAARLDQEASDLQLTPEQRTLTAKELKTAGTLHETNRLDLGEQADRLAEIRQETIAAREAKDDARVEALRAEREQITTGGGKELAEFSEQRAGYRRRRHHVEYGAAGLDEKSARVLSQLAEIEDTNFRSMERLVKKGQQLERDLDRLDADAVDARVESLVGSMDKIARQADKAVERARLHIENINKRAAAAETKDIGKGAEISAKGDAEIKARVEQEALNQQKLSERMHAIADRLKVIQTLDHDAMMDGLRDAIQKSAREISAASLERGARAARLGDRLTELHPDKVTGRLKTISGIKAEMERKFLETWETKALGEGVDAAARTGKFDEIAKQIADEIFNKWSGQHHVGSDRPEFFTITTRGPQKGRTVHLRDETQFEEWFENNVEFIGARYQRIMSRDIELAKMDREFGGVGDPSLPAVFARIKEDVDRLVALEPDPIKAGKIREAATKEKKTMEGLRDVFRGTYGETPAYHDYGYMLRNALHFNYVVAMGQVVLSSLTEPIRIVMAKGMANMMGVAGTSIAHRGVFKLSRQEIKWAGNSHEVALRNRLASIADIYDPFTSRGRTEKILENMTNVASDWNGIRVFTDWMKDSAGVAIQNEILDTSTNWAKAKPKDIKRLAYLGVDESGAGRIAAKFAEHGETVGGIRVAHTDKWIREGGTAAEQALDRETVSIYRDALNKDLNSMVVTRGIGDLPLFANKPLGRLLLQFNTFNLASHNRIMLRGLQEGHARFLSTVSALTTAGMAITYMKAALGNRLDKLPDMRENPGWWIAEGLDNSGLFGLFFFFANGIERAGGINPIKTPIKMADEKSQQSEKIRNRSLWSLAGPSAQTAGDIAHTALVTPRKLLRGDELSKEDKSSAQRPIPFSSYPGMRQFLRFIVDPPED